MSKSIKDREYLYIQQRDENTIVIDQLLNHSRLSDRSIGTAYAFQETLASLGLTFEASKVGIHRQLIVGGTNELVRQNRYRLAHAAGRIAREAAQRRHPRNSHSPEELTERYTGHLQNILDYRIPHENSKLPFSFTVGGLVGGIAQEIAPNGTLVHLQDKTPWFTEPAERKQFGLYIPKDIPEQELARRKRSLELLQQMHEKSAALAEKD